MNTKLTALLTSAIVTGLLASQAAQAKENTTKSPETATADKNGCGGKHDEKNSCKGMKDSKAKKADKNSCKNGCGEAKEHKAEGK